MKNETRAFLTLFDPLAREYESWFETRLGAFVARRERDLILRLVRPQPGKTIAEVGCGTGYFLRLLATLGARCIGVEPSAEMLAVATSQSRGGIEYMRGVGEALPFPDQALDTLLYMTTLEFVEDVDACIAEAARVVKPGGRLVFGVLNTVGPWAEARRREGGLWAAARFFSTEDLKAMLSPLGVARLEYCVHVPPGAGRLPSPILPLVDRVLRLVRREQGALIGIEVILRRP